jgi:hypothetical protein
VSDGEVIPLPRVGEIVADDVAELAAEFPDWQVGADWITANSGTDFRFVWARRDDVILTAWSRAGLAEQIRATDRR